jgi:uncharacterized protein YqjF (DUF2071 family)
LHPAFARTDHRPWPLPDRPWIGRQRWLDPLFAHWPLPASALQPLVPPPVRVQEFDGTSWVGLVPFRMEDVMLRGVPAVPGISAFPEMNLRLYVEHGGRPGVWFVSLDASSRLAVWAARRFAHLPYFVATMRVRAAGHRVVYRSFRRGVAPAVELDATFWPESAPYEARPGTLDHFLVERYCLYTHRQDGTILRGDIHHVPWPLQRARAEIRANTVGRAQGIAVDGPPPLLHFSRRQDVVLWALTQVVTTEMKNEK